MVSSRPRRSIRQKLNALVITSVGVSVALVAGVSAWRDSTREAVLQTRRLTATAQVIASLSGEATLANDRHGAFEALRAIGRAGDIPYARIETTNHKLLAETGAGARLTNDASVTESDGLSPLAILKSRTVEVSVPIVFAQREVGRLILLGELEGVAERLWVSLLTSVIAALAAGGLGLAVAKRLQRRIAAPILALTEAMGQVRATHDYTREAIVETDDEVGALVEGFNAMLGEVRRRDARIAAQMAGLERTVAERTADLVAAKDDADAANAAKSEFLATMSHEIRTPMNGIMVMAEMLAAGELPSRQRRFAEVIAKSGSSLLAIINDILDFSKIEAGKMELESAPVEPDDIADDVASLFWEKARSKGLDLAVYVAPAVPQVIAADAVRLRQIMGNLLNNAIKFTDTGGVMLELTAPAAGCLHVAVHDTGIGIPQDKIPSLFSAFTQADQSTTRRFGGTGLGLAICKRIVEAMGGELSARSVMGEGSVFSFRIPVDVVEPAAPAPTFGGTRTGRIEVAGQFSGSALFGYLSDAGLNLQGAGADLIIGDPSRISERQGAGAVICLGEYGDDAPARLQRAGVADVVLTQPLRRRDLMRVLAAWQDGAPLEQAAQTDVTCANAEHLDFSGRTVLVVDDSAVNREVAQEALSRLGVEVVLACDGLEGVNTALARTFDLILMDGSMPEMDGYEASRRIRAAQTAAGTPSTPIVALTAHVVGTAADAWREAGMDGVLHKPFTLAALSRILGQFVTATSTAPAPATAAASELITAAPAMICDLFDPEVLGELNAMATAGRADFVERVRKLYRENAPRAAQEVVAAAQASDPAAAAKAAHALKSMSLNMGARVVASLAARIESDAREGGVIDRQAAEGLYRKLLETLDAMHDQPGTGDSPMAANAIDPDAQLMRDLAGAGERGELRLVYQTQVDRDGQTIVGLESLIRWTHPERGDISPAIFIPLAEQHGMIRDVTRWVLDQVMVETADLVVPVGFNASAIEFGDPAFVDDVAMLAARRRFDPTRLEIEITETAILNDGAEVRRNINRLHQLGVRIALDDFGVGYSSLSHLRLFPFDKLKIDRAFVTDCAQSTASATLVHAVVSVGRALGMKVVAEGIETEAQQKFLRLAGVHSLQGYLFGKPAPVDEIRARLAAQPTKPHAKAG